MVKIQDSVKTSTAVTTSMIAPGPFINQKDADVASYQKLQQLSSYHPRISFTITQSMSVHSPVPKKPEPHKKQVPVVPMIIPVLNMSSLL